jgi:hypothetical protein
MQKAELKDSEANSLWLTSALCAIAASTMIVEIVLTKFIGFKVYHHFVHLIISTVILSFGMAGAYLYLVPARGSMASNWQVASREAAVYSILLVLTVLIFCWLPIDPYNLELSLIWRMSSIAIYFMLFSVPFFFAGLCISRVLTTSSLPATKVYFFDLSAAALAAALTPSLLEYTGGYGCVCIASALGIFAFFAFQKASGKLEAPLSIFWSIAFVLSATLLIVYPLWATSNDGLDIRSSKDVGVRHTFSTDFAGIARTYWTPLARIDVSRTNWSNCGSFLYGIVPASDTKKLEGRLVLVDGGAHTRQFKANGRLEDYPFFSSVLWASPYIIKPDTQDSLIIGAGGGIDILVGKYFKVPRVDALELNPATYKHVLLGQDDAEAAQYQPWLASNEKTRVRIFNTEARHYFSLPTTGRYDVIQASGVDTLTAVASGALANSDNYLYTLDAVKSYAEKLKPGGLLSLSHWRVQPPQLGLRMFVTYIEYLEQIGNKTPYRNLVVVGNNWVDTIMKTTPFTEAEVQRIRDWADRSHIAVMYDPLRRTNDGPGVTKIEAIYDQLAYASKQERKALLDEWKDNVLPVSDDRPYFYQLSKELPLFGSSAWVTDSMLAICVTFVFVLILSVVPLFKVRPIRMSVPLASALVFFAACGFAFLLFEVSIIQLFSIFVGGPMYALAVVLVSVLAGYSIGCLLANRLQPTRNVFLFVGAAICLMLLSASVLLPSMLSSLMQCDVVMRILIAGFVAFLMSFIIGIPVALGMEAVKSNPKIGYTVPWMWGVSSGFNALASACFVLISQRIGIASTLGIAAVLYIGAITLFALLGPVAVASEKTE